MSRKQFAKELAKPDNNKRVPGMRTMTFAELAALSTAYVNRTADEQKR